MKYFRLNSNYKNVLPLSFNSSIDYFHLIQLTLAFTLPFHRNISSILTILLLLRWFMEGNIVNKIKSVFTNKYGLLFTSIFFVPLASLLYTTDIANGLYNTEKILSIVIFPLVLLSSPIPNTHQVINILKSFCLGCFGALLIALFHASMLNFQQNKFNRIIPGLYDTNIVTIIGISHVYFGLYLALAILIITTATIDGKIFYFKNKWIQVIIGICLLLFLILLGAKMAIIAIFLILLINLTSYIIRSGRYILAIVCCLLLGCFFYLTISIFPVTKERFEALSNQENYQIGDNQWNSIASRISILYCTKAVLQQNWLLGVGIGDAQQELNECFTSNKFGTLVNMNAHNQFLQYLLTSGIIAFIAFTLCFLYPFVKFFRLKKVNYLYIDFLLLFAFCCLTESMLESNKGIVFYSYFNSLLFLHVKKLQEEENSASLNR